MIRPHAFADHISSRRLGTLLLLSFVLTIASFLLSRWISESRSSGITAAASSITSVAAPAIEHLSKARTELRRMQMLLGDELDGTNEPNDGRLQQSFRRSREEFEREWSLYLTLPAYQGEGTLWGRIAEDKRAMDAATDDALRAITESGPKGNAAQLYRNAEPLFDNVDLGLRQAIDINVSNSASLALKVSQLRIRSRTLGRFLDALSAVLALIVAVLVTRLVRRFAHLMGRRVSELEHFAGRVAHDIRSPLLAVSLAFDLAKKSTTIDAKTRSALARGTNTLQRVGQLVDGLLVFARTGANPTKGEQADLQDVLCGVVDDMAPIAQESEVDVEVKEVPATVLACSPGVLTSLISNLIGNAVKYMGDAPVRKVEVRVRLVGRATRVEVQDTGPGVPRELWGRVFDPYVRGAGSTAPGLGLGLATVRRLAEAHGGAAGMTPVETGSLFWFEIPRAQASPVDHDSTKPVHVHLGDHFGLKAR